MKEAIEAAMGEAPDIVVANAVQQYDWTSVLEQGVEDYESQFRKPTTLPPPAALSVSLTWKCPRPLQGHACCRTSCSRKPSPRR